MARRRARERRRSGIKYANTWAKISSNSSSSRLEKGEGENQRKININNEFSYFRTYKMYSIYTRIYTAPLPFLKSISNENQMPKMAILHIAYCHSHGKKQPFDTVQRTQAAYIVYSVIYSLYLCRQLN